MKPSTCTKVYTRVSFHSVASGRALHTHRGSTVSTEHMSLHIVWHHHVHDITNVYTAYMCMYRDDTCTWAMMYVSVDM